MIDLHLHLLPGVDDGARDFEEAALMAHRAAESGCTALVATPHQRHPRWWNDHVEELEAMRRRLQEMVGPEPRLHLGGEIRVSDSLLEDLERLGQTGALSLAGSSYLLLEFDRQGYGPDPETAVHEAVVCGWRPIVAHPEFLPGIVEDPSCVERLVELGAAMQITAHTLTGGFGKSLQRLAYRLIDAGLVQFVASDGHRLAGCRVGLDEAHREINQLWGEAAARRLTQENPAAVLADRPLVRNRRDPRPGAERARSAAVVR